MSFGSAMVRRWVAIRHTPLDIGVIATFVTEREAVQYADEHVSVTVDEYLTVERRWIRAS